MNKQEILKQADYNFQRGNRKLAKKYLADLLQAYPNDEAVWLLLAKVNDHKEEKLKCYEQALRINPKNNESRIALARLKDPTPTITRKEYKPTHYTQPLTGVFRGVGIFVAILLGLATTSFAIARTNPDSPMARLFSRATPTPLAETISDDLAAKTRADISANYPQYSLLIDSLLSLAMSSTDNGMDGAPERPGAAIIPSDNLADEARTIVENSLPQPGSLTTMKLSEQQLTSWLAREMGNSPDLPLSDIQVYLRNDEIQIWGMVIGDTNSTSALIVGAMTIDANSNPYFEIESMQVGQQVIPGLLTSQIESWINQSLAESINQQVPGLQVMNINISNGLITISGMR